MSDYYSRHFLEYHQQTVSLQPDYLRPFIDRLRPGEVILDVGCGGGRDLLYLKRRGFQVIGFEKSPGLAALARIHAKCEVIEGDFETFPFKTLRVGAILLSAALVHIRPDRLENILSRILPALAPDPPDEGVVYLSLKEGAGTVSDDTGRIFHLWDGHCLQAALERCGLSIVHFARTPSSLSPTDIWLGYVAVLPPGNRLSCKTIHDCRT